MMNEGARLLAAIKHIDSRKECNFQFTTSQGLREIFTGDRRGNAVSEGNVDKKVRSFRRSVLQHGMGLSGTLFHIFSRLNSYE